MWDLIVSVPDHCLSFYFIQISIEQIIISQPTLYKMESQTQMPSMMISCSINGRRCSGKPCQK